MKFIACKKKKAITISSKTKQAWEDGIRIFNFWNMGGINDKFADVPIPFQLARISYMNYSIKLSKIVA